MKCPECDFNHPSRLGLHCSGPGCSYKFSFNPKNWDSYGMTDGRFLAAIRKASQNDTAFYTRNQLYSAYAARQTYPRAIHIISALVTFTIAAVFYLSGEGPLILCGVVSLMGMLFLLSAIFGRPEVMKRKKFAGLINQWQRDGKPMERLIDQPSLHNPPPDWQESDIYDYGVERILIVQHDVLVDLMVLNGVHSQERMLVMSESGYPSYLMPMAKRLLEESPDLPVFILHDADKTGVAMKERVNTMELPIAGHPITDLGMTPQDFHQLKRTKNYEPKRRARDLPVDAMMTPFLLTGLSACFVTNVALGELIDEQARQKAIGDAHSHFG